MPKRRARHLERAQAFGHDLLADAVAGNDRDPMWLHRSSVKGEVILGYAGTASKHGPKAMRSIVIVALQLSLIVAIMLPLDAGGWSLSASALVGAGIATGAWALTANRPGNFSIRPEVKPGGGSSPAGRTPTCGIRCTSR